MALYATENDIPIGLFQSMDPAAIMLVPVVVVVTAVVIFLHSLVLKFLSTAMVRNKVVVITDALTGLGKECAKLFHEGGARVILCGKTLEKLEGFADNLTSATDPKLTFPPKLVLVDFGDMNNMPDVIGETLECYAFPCHLCCLLSMRSKPSLTVCGLRSRSMASLSALSTTPSSSPLHLGKRPRSPSGQVMGITPAEAANEILKILNSKKREVVMAHSLPKMAIYARSLMLQE
ncbi:dehydrogenase/reductase SDR family member 7C-B-like isoform X2 [Oncorhynchus mykiss]|uniref:dehydrogenase/reductase SDR family member 7C-B-like isoform X2 n=1 Tax=Oncorhynchus mykiss TaxID=8022 RepID=UPI0018776BA4|nr:dehydrogenase/reductase SDR family member 7C-B-like isoform X2 [Oncorhynchus mykiss]